MIVDVLKSNETHHYGVAESYWEEILWAATSVDSVQEILLFGSRAKGNYRTGSDIDLAILGDDISVDDWLKVKRRLYGLELLYKFDVVLVAKLKQEDPLRAHIDRVGISIWKRSGESILLK
jgi:uncharacterized protein